MRALVALRDFWFGPTHAAPLAAFRISLGLILLLDTSLTLLPNAAMWFGVDGTHSPEETSWWIGQVGRWGLFDGRTELATLRLGLVGLMLCAWGLIFGLGTRACALGAYVLLVSFHHRNPNILNAGDILLRTGLFC